MNFHLDLLWPRKKKRRNTKFYSCSCNLALKKRRRRSSSSSSSSREIFSKNSIAQNCRKWKPLMSQIVRKLFCKLTTTK